MDVNSGPNGALGEATEFFATLSTTSKNPFIASMARESLRKLHPATTAEQSAGLFQSTEVPLLPQNDHTFVVPALVNHHTTATFLIDTGASYTVITPEMAESLGIRITPDGPRVPVTTANGTLNAPVVQIKEIKLGDMRVENVDAVVTRLGEAPQISGLLGMSFFRGLNLSFLQDKLLISR